MTDAIQSEVILLAVPFRTRREIAAAAESWQGKIVIDVTNAYGVSPEELDHLPSSAVISRALPGAKLVKAFNHLPAETLAEDPGVEGGRRVLFLSSDDEEATVQVAALVTRARLCPCPLGQAGGRRPPRASAREHLGVADLSRPVQERRISMYAKTNWPEQYDPRTSAIYALDDIDVKAPPEVVWRLPVDAEHWSSYFPPEDQVKILSGGSELALDTKWSRVTEWELCAGWRGQRRWMVTRLVRARTTAGSSPRRTRVATC